MQQTALPQKISGVLYPSLSHGFPLKAEIFSLLPSISSWWFGTFSIFPYIGNDNPN